MRAIIWGPTFKRSYKKMAQKRPDLHEKVAETLNLLAWDSFVAQLETH